MARRTILELMPDKIREVLDSNHECASHEQAHGWERLGSAVVLGGLAVALQFAVAMIVFAILVAAVLGVIGVS